MENLIKKEPLEKIVAQYTKLKQKGSLFYGKCPLNNSHKHSFFVDKEKQLFFCLKCGKSGDVFNFLSELNQTDIRSVVATLARKHHIEMDLDIPEPQEDRVYELNRTAATFFRQALLRSEQGKDAREYITQRGMSDEAMQHYFVGYAPDSYVMLRDYLISKGYSEKELEAAFLCRKSEKTGQYYDIWRDRIIFPIIDTKKHIIGFGGRILHGEKSPQKYINTGESPVFCKSRTLFGLNYAQRTCADSLIICEGYMDVIALYSAGFKNAVATLGTALTKEHIKVIKKYTRSVVLAYDDDVAGRKATEKALILLSEEKIPVKILPPIKGAKDPDEYIKKFGSEAFKKLLTQSESVLDYKIRTAGEDVDGFVYWLNSNLQMKGDKNERKSMRMLRQKYS